MKMPKSKKNFTLIELIVVIAIVIVLAAAAFLVLSKWIGNSRNTRRYSDLNTIYKALDFYFVNKTKYPEPSDNVILTNQNGVEIAKQGVFDNTVAKNGINISTVPKDPEDDTYYAYTVRTYPKTEFEIGGMLEENTTFQGSNNVYAGITRIPYIIGNIDHVNMPTVLSLMNTKTSTFVKKSNVSTSTGDTVKIQLDLANLTGDGKGNTIAPILSVTGDNLLITKSEVAAAVNTIVSTSSTSNNSNNNTVDPNLAIINALQSGLVLYYDMSTTFTSGNNTYLKDLSNNGNNGSLIGSINIGGIGGQVGNATDFDGVDDRILALASNSLYVKNNISISAFIKPNGNNIAAIVEYNTNNSSCSNSTCGLHIWQYNSIDKLYYNLDTYSTNSVGSTPAGILSNGTWYYIVLTYDGNYAKIYINGNEVSTTNYVNKTLNTNLNLNIGSRAGAYLYKGIIDEVRIYNRALAINEIKYLSYGSDKINGSCGSINNKVLSSIPTENYCNFGLNTTIIENANNFTWSCYGINGGTVANCSATKLISLSKGTQTNPGLSCLDLKNTGVTIDGNYYIKPDSDPAFLVYCDMTTDEGGWTLIMRGYGGDIAGWNSTGAVNPSRTPLPDGQTFKLSDNQINTIRANAGVYKLSLDGKFNNHYYLGGSCPYIHKGGGISSVEACRKAYNDITLNNLAKQGIATNVNFDPSSINLCYREDCGNPLMPHMRDYWYEGPAGCGDHGGCGGNTTNCNMTIWLR